MIPLCMRIAIRGEGRPRGVRLSIPVILAWIVELALLVAALPFALWVFVPFD